LQTAEYKVAQAKYKTDTTAMTTAV